MKLQDALNILGLSGEVTFDDAKAAYRRASMKFHPDRNPGGLEMMKAVNAAWAVCQATDFSDGQVQGNEGSDYGDALMAAINAVVNLDGLSLEICGAWVWMTGNTYPHKEAIKAAGFMWASKKKQWYFRPAEKAAGYKKGEWDMDKIRDKFGSEKVDPRQDKWQGSAKRIS